MALALGFDVTARRKKLSFSVELHHQDAFWTVEIKTRGIFFYLLCDVIHSRGRVIFLFITR
jgi:hypothetical protein